MTKYYTNIISILNICKKPSKKSEIVSQMIYGDSFSVLKKYNQWIKIKTKATKAHLESPTFIRILLFESWALA